MLRTLLPTRLGAALGESIDCGVLRTLLSDGLGGDVTVAGRRHDRHGPVETQQVAVDGHHVGVAVGLPRLTSARRLRYKTRMPVLATSASP